MVDAQGAVRGLDSDGAAGVDHADLDTLPGNDYRAAATDPSLNSQRLGRGLRSRAGGSGVADAGVFGGGQRVGQAA